MAVEFDKLWEAFKTRGPRFAVYGLAPVLAFAFVNKIFDNALTTGIDILWGLVNPPTFLITFSEPVDHTNWVVLKDGSTHEEKIVPEWLGDRAAKITVSPGLYTLKIHKVRDYDDTYVLNAPLDLHVGTSTFPVDASQRRWALVTETAPCGSEKFGRAPNLSGTRWTTTQSDWEEVTSAANDKLGAILKVALGQVGVASMGSDTDQHSIAEYWKATDFAQTMVPNPMIRWGGAFLDWIMNEAGANPNRSAAYQSWLAWGESVQLDVATPGMIAIFDLPGLPPVPSHLLVGIFLRQKTECTEVIAGNISQRVAITCVCSQPKSVRKPTAD